MRVRRCATNGRQSLHHRRSEMSPLERCFGLIPSSACPFHDRRAGDRGPSLSRPELRFLRGRRLHAGDDCLDIASRDCSNGARLEQEGHESAAGCVGAVLGPAFGLHGFADQSHFTRVFDREVGCGPGQWRRLLTFSKILVIVSASIASISTSFSDLTIFSVVVL